MSFSINKPRNKRKSLLPKTNKKGEKELQMIFGLFVLLIISLVVLMLFFRFIKGSTGSIRGVQKDFFAQNKIDNAIETCKSLCDEIETADDAIDFCSRTMKIDFNGDGMAANFTRANRGAFTFCEDRIPCFVLYPKCPNADNPIYNGNYCKHLLASRRPEYLKKLMYKTPEGTCNLPTTAGEGAEANWVLKYGYYTTSTTP